MRSTLSSSSRPSEGRYSDYLFERGKSDWTPGVLRDSDLSLRTTTTSSSNTTDYGTTSSSSSLSGIRSYSDGLARSLEGSTGSFSRLSRPTPFSPLDEMSESQSFSPRMKQTSTSAIGSNSSRAKEFFDLTEEHANKISELNHEKRTLKEDLEKALRAKTLAEEKIEQLNRRHQDQQNEIQVAKQHYSEHVQSMEELLALERKRRQDESEQVQFLMQQLKEDVERNNTERQRSRERISLLEEQALALTKSSERVPALTGEIASLHMQLEGLRSTCDGLLRELGESKAQFEEAKLKATSEHQANAIDRSDSLLEKEELKSIIRQKDEELRKLRERQGEDMGDVRGSLAHLEREMLARHQADEEKLEKLSAKLIEVMASAAANEVEWSQQLEAARSEFNESLQSLNANSNRESSMSLMELKSIVVAFEESLGVMPSSPRVVSPNEFLDRMKHCLGALSAQQQESSGAGGVRKM